MENKLIHQNIENPIKIKKQLMTGASASSRALSGQREKTVIVPKDES